MILFELFWVAARFFFCFHYAPAWSRFRTAWEQSQAAINGVGRAQGVRLEAVTSGLAIRTCDYGTLRRRSLVDKLACT